MRDSTRAWIDHGFCKKPFRVIRRDAARGLCSLICEGAAFSLTPPLLDHPIGAADKPPFVARLNRPDRATARLLLGVFLQLIRRGGARFLTKRIPSVSRSSRPQVRPLMRWLEMT